MSLTLTKEELFELTGYKLVSKQEQWLRENNIPYLPGRSRPRVLREVLFAQFGVTMPKSTRTEPNFDAIDDGKAA